MKSIIILLIGITLYGAGDTYTNEETYIIDKIQKLPICPSSTTKSIKNEISIINNTYMRKTTFIKLCQTKQGKIKMKISKKITINENWKHIKK